MMAPDKQQNEYCVSNSSAMKRVLGLYAPEL